MQEEIQRLAPEIIAYYEKGVASLEMNQWLMNPANFEVMRAMVAWRDLDPKVTHFGLVGMTNVLANVFHTWGCGDFLGLSDWFLKLLFDEVDRFSASDALLCACCRTYARIVRLGWHTSPEFGRFFQNFRHFFDGNLKQRCMGINLCNSIMKDMKEMYNKLDTEEMKVFKETTLFECLNFAVHAMNKVLGGDVPPGSPMDEMLKVVEAAIQFVIGLLDDVEQAHDLQKMWVKVCDGWKGKFESVLIATNMFQTYERADQAFLQKLALDGLLRLAAVQRTTHRNFDGFIDTMVRGMSTIIERGLHFENANNIAAFSNLLVKVKATITYEDACRLECFGALVDHVYNLCEKLFLTPFLRDYPGTLENLLWFWDLMVQSLNRERIMGTRDERYLAMLDTVSQKYVMMLMDFFEKFHADAVTILFEDLTRIHPLIQFVTKVSKFQADVCYPKLHTMFIQLLERFLSEPRNQTVEGQMCLLACALLTPLLAPSSRLADQQNKAKLNFYQAIRRFIEDTGSFVDTHNGGPLLTERVVLCIIGQKKPPESLVNAWLYGNADGKPGGAADGKAICRELLQLYFRRALLILRKFPAERQLIDTALDVLLSYIQEKKMVHKDCSQAAISELIDKIGNYEDAEQFRFLEVPTNRRCRVKFNQMMAQLIDINKDRGQASFAQFWRFIDSQIGRLQENIENRSDEIEALAGGLMLDICGLFQGIERRYTELFSHFFPDAIELLQKAASNFPALQLPYLKMLSDFVYNKQSRIHFHNHSADGLKMFLTAARSLIQYFTSIPSSRDGYAGVQADPRAFRYAMKIMDEILENNCSNIGVLEVYNDPTLINLFQAFLEVTKHLDMMDLLQHPKVKDTIILLLNRLYSSFIKQILGIDWRFLCVSLSICETVRVDQDQTRSIQKTFMIIKKITRFCVENLSGPIGADIKEATKELFNHILLMLEQILFTYGIVRFHSNSEVTALQCPGAIDLMEMVLRMQPTAWNEVKQRLRLFMQHSRNDELREDINKLLEISY